MVVCLQLVQCSPVNFDLTFVFDERLQLLVQSFMPASDVQVKREVTTRLLLCSLPPLVKH